MNILGILFLVNYIYCLIAIFHMIFISKKKPERIIAWTIVLLVPVVGLLIYLLVGAGISRFAKRNIEKYKFSNDEYQKHINKQIKTLESDNIKN